MPLRRAVHDVAFDQVHDVGGRRAVRPGFQQRRDGLGAAERRPEHEGGLSPLGFAGVHRGAMVEQDGDGAHISGGGGEVERRRARFGHRRRVGPCLGQNRDDLAVTLLGRYVQRSVRAQPRGRLERCPRVDQQPRDFAIPVQGRPVNAGHPVAVGRVHVGAVREQRPDGLDVVPFGGVGDG